MKQLESSSNVKRLDGTLSPESAEFFQHFFSRHQVSLYRFVRSLGVADDLARDLVQDVYLRLIRQNEPAKLAKTPRGYLYRIAINLLRDNLRRNRQHTRVVAESAHNSNELSLVKTPEHILLDRERVELLKAAIHKLEPEERQILLLHRLHNMSCEEIAAELTVPRRTVERRLAAALDFCRSQVWKAT
jgi:RNA polymerase sigma factor (sigma-70 family)